MIQFITDQPGEAPIVWEWLHKRTKLPWSSDLRSVALMRSDGTISAAVGYNAWTEKSCWMHVAFDNPHCLTRDLLRAAFEYPFIQCGKEAVYGLTPLHIEEALRMNRKLGFKEVLRTVDCVMFEMKANDCRWLKGVKHGRQEFSTTGA